MTFSHIYFVKNLMNIYIYIHLLFGWMKKTLNIQSFQYITDLLRILRTGCACVPLACADGTERHRVNGGERGAQSYDQQGSLI